MYKGEVNVTEYEIGPLLDAAEYLKVKGLTLAVKGRQEAQAQLYSHFGHSSVTKPNITEQMFNPPRKKMKTNDNILSVPLTKSYDANPVSSATTTKNTTNFSIESISESIKSYNDHNSALQLTTGNQMAENFYINPLRDNPLASLNSNMMTASPAFWTSGSFMRDVSSF